MSITSTSPNKQTYIVWARDYTDPECWSRRDAVTTPEHLTNVATKWDPDFLKVAGVLIPDQYANLPLPEKRWNGSFFIAKSESLEAMWEVVKSDTYYRNNVWDKDAIVVMEILPVTVLPDRGVLSLPGPPPEAGN
ncbi:hypothetical protein EVG20_g1492 [Dentipellis fragilis]|uniref:YCII-related domain-containing protein n=1 Tax=Dentipellis fragilis TaxID=205917 RepID=A0A4Y9Z9I8_9AGAM|nr:hypothetical protein EVG20_g1492 [Dentipellis fragilis]